MLPLFSLIVAVVTIPRCLVSARENGARSARGVCSPFLQGQPHEALPLLQRDGIPAGNALEGLGGSSDDDDDGVPRPVLGQQVVDGVLVDGADTCGGHTGGGAFLIYANPAATYLLGVFFGFKQLKTVKVDTLKKKKRTFVCLLKRSWKFLCASVVSKLSRLKGSDFNRRFHLIDPFFSDCINPRLLI